MNIQDYIRKEFERRLEEHKCLVVYDEKRRYADISKSISNCTIIDGSISTIIGREEALDKWISMSTESDIGNRLLIYLPFRRNERDSAVLSNPYLIFEIGGTYFPKGDSDSFYTLCLRAFPDKVEKLDNLFINDPDPMFDTINAAIIDDRGCPILSSMLNVESTSEIITAILSPLKMQHEQLNLSDNWYSEFKQFLKERLGYSLVTKSKKWNPINQELWRVILFSEFVFDLPGALPDPIANIPFLDRKHKILVYSICDNLRHHEKHRNNYIENARRIEEELQLRKSCQNITEFGERDTFEFEGITSLTVFVKEVLAGNLMKAESILSERKRAIWVKYSEERQTIWTIAGKCVEFIEQLEKSSILLKDNNKSLTDLVDLYSSSLYKLDKVQREFENVVSDSFGRLFTLDKLVEKLRADYLIFIDKLHQIFISLIIQEGWPINGKYRNTQLFDIFIAPLIKERKKTAFLMVDSFRFELAVELTNKLNDFKDINLYAVCAQLPTTTKVGMASLLPNADGKFSLVRDKDKLIPTINGININTAEDRITYVKSIYGDLAHSIWLDELFVMNGTDIPASTMLLIVKTKDIDDLGEGMPGDAVAIIPRTIKKLFYAINEIKKLGFEYITIATDHGFILNSTYNAGDNVQKPKGEWIESKRRYLLGEGDTNEFTIGFNPIDLGIKADAKMFVTPKSHSTFYKGSLYYHEGLSLQECVLPFIVLPLSKGVEEQKAEIKIILSYKSGKTKEITTRRPMIDIDIESKELFSKEVEIMLEAYSGNEIVGEPAPSDYLDLATNCLKLTMGDSYKIAIKMQEGFEGDFEVRATDPVTNFTYSTLKLKTNYMDS